MTLESLTKEQEDKFPYYVEKWVRIGNSLVTEDFYTDDIVNSIKVAVQKMYKIAGEKIELENVLISPSPSMSPFMAAAHVHGKKGTPTKKMKCKIPNMESVEAFVNSFANPKEIVQKAGAYCELRYWGALDAGFCAFVDFFNTETELGNTALVPHKETIEVMHNEITCLCYDLLIADGLCVVSKKPIYQDFDMSEGYPVAKSGKIKWADGTVIEY